MPIDSPWPTLFCTLLLLGLVQAPVFDTLDTPATHARDRVTMLDGLRGFLALAVFFHHAAIYHVYIADGRWMAPTSRFYAMLGPVGVALFFMITGFLFWGKLLAEHGRPNWRLLYIGRVFRIGPLYVATIAAFIAIVFAQSRWQLHGTMFGLVKSCAWWIALGMLGQGPDINHHADAWIILAGVTWTLQYEWWFYAALLPMAFVVRAYGTRGPHTDARRSALFCIGGFAVGCLVTGLTATDAAVSPPVVCATLFFAGMVAASVRDSRIVQAVPPALAAPLAMVLIATPFIACRSMNTPGAILLLTTAFILIASSRTSTGLLGTRAARRLGDISYGLYLLQGLVLAAVFASPSVRTFALGSSVRYWIVIVGCAVLLMIVAALGFVAIERPGITLGRRIGRRLKRRATRQHEPVAP